MKKLLFSIVLLLIAQYVLANKIDKLSTDEEVASFITSLDKKFHKKNIDPLIIKSTDEVLKDIEYAKPFEIKNWIKADFNSDGLTDLLAIAYWQNDYHSYVVIDAKNDKFRLIELYYSPFDRSPGYQFAGAIKAGTIPSILFYSSKGDTNRNEKRLFMLKDVPMVDTLTYKFDEFIELNKQPSDYKIVSMKFETSMCFGTCPVFSIDIDKAGRAVYTAGKYSTEEGTFITRIKTKDLNQIRDLINYIGIKGLKDYYRVNWTDYPTCWITIKFDDGLSKKIEDYGELGTFGLRKLYQLFFELCKNQDWVQE